MRVYAELNDLLPVEWRFCEFRYPMAGGNNAKHLVESAGIPHTEIALLMRNGTPVGFDASVEHGDRVSVFPAFTGLGPGPAHPLRPGLSDTGRFVLDVHLGKLAVLLRLLGFDALFPGDVDDSVLAEISSVDSRILLTCDRMLLKRGSVVHGCLIRSRRPEEQAREVLKRFSLADSVKPFSRCPRCSGLLSGVAKEDVAHLLKPLTRQHYNEFRRCSRCGAIYWKGSHYGALCSLLCRLGVNP
ncbi:MAG: Mut7-C RNAse domain-containing protein [Candidatus Fermentibacteraceae bacterium]